MKKIVLAMPLLMAMVACGPAPVESKPQYERITVLDIKRPKHFKITYRLVRTGKVYTQSNKHCNDWRRVKEGHTYIADVSKTGCSLIRSIR